MKQLFLILSTLFLVSLSVCGGNTYKKGIKQSSIEYETYHNQQYDYSVQYPGFLIPQGESDNGDGQKFFSLDDRIQLLVYRDYKNDFLTGGDLYTIGEAFMEDLKFRESVFNEILNDNHYIIKYKTDDILYTYYALLHGDNYFNILFQYPEKDKDMMKDIIEYVIDSFEIDALGAEETNVSVGDLENMYLVFIEGFLKDCYWGENFNKLLRKNDNTLAKYIAPNMDVRRYYAPGTVSILASRSENFGFDEYTDFESKPETNGEEVFKLIASDENPCMLNLEGNNKIYYQWIETVPDLLVDMETFETKSVEIANPDAKIIAVYLPNTYGNPVGYYFIYTPDGWKLGFVDDALCGA